MGVVLLSNHEGKYLGNPLFRDFFVYLNSRVTMHEVIFIHPNNPTLDLNGAFLPADPSKIQCDFQCPLNIREVTVYVHADRLRRTAIYPSGLVEFYFETARTVMDLTISQTFLNFTNLRWHIPQAGGSFPSIEDRFINSFPALEAPSKAVYNTRWVALFVVSEVHDRSILASLHSIP